MDLIQLMCAGGCGEKPALLMVIKNLLTIVRFVFLVLPFLLSFYQCVFKRKNKKKELKNNIIKYFVVCIGIFLILTIIGALIELFLMPEYDNEFRCWCE